MTHVLIPLDGSSLAEAVIPVALTLEPERVTLLHVTEPGEEPRDAERVFQRARDVAARECRTLTRPGRPAEAIVAAASEVGATGIALSTHGRTGFNRWVLGSVAEEVARTAEAPVLLVRAGLTPQPGPVLERPLVGYDGSDLSWRAVEAVARLGGSRPGRRLDLVAAHDVAPLGPEGPDPTIERFLAAQRGALQRQLDEAAGRVRQLGLEASVQVREGRPSTVLLEAAERSGSTLLAVATHGRSALTRWIFGSVAEELLHTSPLPLLIVR